MSETPQRSSMLTAAKPHRWQGVSRWRAFAMHLGGSALIVGIVCALIFFVWYPDPYFQATGAWNVLRVLIGVDLVLGPLLTLIVFRPGKWGLTFDLWFIAIVQAAALAYGVTVIYRERPYFTVFALDRFYVLAHADAYEPELADPTLTASERIGKKPLRGPLLLAATRPNDTEGMNRLIEETLFGGKPDIERRPLYWGRYTDSTQAVRERAKPLAALERGDPLVERRVQHALAGLGREPSSVAFLPVIAKNRDLTMLVDATTGLPLDVLDVDPWASAGE